MAHSGGDFGQDFCLRIASLDEVKALRNLLGGIVTDDFARTAVHTNKIRLRWIELKQTLGGGDLSTGRCL